MLNYRHLEEVKIGERLVTVGSLIYMDILHGSSDEQILNQFRLNYWVLFQRISEALSTPTDPVVVCRIGDELDVLRQQIERVSTLLRHLLTLIES